MALSITHLFTKLKTGSAMVELKTLNLKLGHGIEGDINADPISPRQVLIVRYEDILDLLSHLNKSFVYIKDYLW
ncbi:hypothetical protein LC613_27500 [Nostoc sphaeroides CHAB 2801]|uniref:hypothetical protein n=1 Tax=Nostoc sphaeroides TaxID=446679 RepID=UPI000E4C5821|nr:hypothetical protein [Nostoc sphaeroides]MCC5631496.1 hypothetical protein [Nostoc sphaeroides CHAB 2801]